VRPRESMFGILRVVKVVLLDLVYDLGIRFHASLVVGSHTTTPSELDLPIVTRHKMAALVGEKEICRYNFAGRCNLGDK
jgi:hypothetical protein